DHFVLRPFWLLNATAVPAGATGVSIIFAGEVVNGTGSPITPGEKPTQSWEKAMHISLVLYAEHEFNASTFTSRVIAGTGSDVY
ncbi:hypothetical protein MJN51_40045, partial [Salmonella enterica subsp. enterica serovar Kentucky]|nr:hypothetical protein [Salmonella enterica subsp. enterica serovar Kentucky]